MKTFQEHYGQGWDSLPATDARDAWNAATQSAQAVCQHEAEALRRANMPLHATGAQGCVNGIEQLVAKTGAAEGEAP